MGSPIRVAILDDHQSVVDGYLYRLGAVPDIEVVGTAIYSEELELLLERHPVDLLLLDVTVPISPSNPQPYPIFHLLPRLLESYPSLSVLVISMHDQRPLIRAVMEAGASGYILKDDHATLKELGNVVLSVIRGGIYLSQRAYKQIRQSTDEADGLGLTPRELQVLSLCAAFPDMPTSEVAATIGVAHSTVRNLLSSAYLRLEVRSRAAAVLKARHLALITPEAAGISIDYPTLSR